MTRHPDINKVLIIGSGPIVIGQAAEFDYAGTQACNAMREEGVTSVLVNSNPATIMTDEDIADIVYIEPLTVEVGHAHHRARAPGWPAADPGRPDRPQPGVELADAGVLEKYNVRAPRHPNGDDPQGRGPRAVQAAAASDRRAGAAQPRPSPPSSDAKAFAGKHRPTARHPPRLHPGRHRRRHRPTHGGVRARSSAAASPPAPSTRSWSSKSSPAGKRSSTR